MTRSSKHVKLPLAVKISIWSIRHQAWLAGQLRIYIYAATALVALLAWADVITIQTAMLATFCGGAIALGLIWTFIQHRKSLLLNIDEPEIRKLAHQAMLIYINQVDPAFTAHGQVSGLHEKHCKDCK